MNKIIKSLLILIISWGPFFAAQAQVGDGKKKAKTDKEQRLPIKIEADKLEAINEKRMVIFTGSVVATQEDRTIKADRLTLYYKRESADRTGMRDPLRGGDLDRIEARGRVTIYMEERIATGDEAVFSPDAQEIILTGNATLREGQNMISGHRVMVYLNENRGIVEGSENKRVTATIYTTEVQEKKR